LQQQLLLCLVLAFYKEKKTDNLRNIQGEFDYMNRNSDPDLDPNRAFLFTSDSDHGESGAVFDIKNLGHYPSRIP
jgi:hypothetical protein